MEDQKSRLIISNLDSQPSDTIPSFLLKTYQILENQKYIEVICWTKNGEGFIVKKVKQFSQNILPIYFRHSNYTSFVRQLNMYDFHKTRQENHQNAFKNLMFKKGFKHLLKDICRKDYKKNKDNTKEGSAGQRGAQRLREGRNQRQYDLTYDVGRHNLKKLSQVSDRLEKKAILLAGVSQIPQMPSDLLKLIDSLFDSKKLHRDMVNRLEQLGTFFSQIEKTPRVVSSLKLQQTVQKQHMERECPTTDPKQSKFMVPRTEQTLGTNISLFSTFNQV